MTTILVWLGIMFSPLILLLLVFIFLLAFIPHLITFGVFTVICVIFERWRYKSIRDERPKPDWTDTGERFIDPETARLTGVYLDTNGQRYYVAINSENS
jgi:hypothetical protein